MSIENSEKPRRWFFTTTAALGSATLLAGCSSDSGGESSTDDESGSDSNTGSQESNGTATEGEASIEWGSSREFTLEEGDGRGPKFDDLAKPVQFEASAGDEVTITQTSDVFDPYLILEGPDGSIVAENDDAAGIGTNSRISTTLSKSGEYTIWAGSFSFDTTGPFTLSLERGS